MPYSTAMGRSDWKSRRDEARWRRQDLKTSRTGVRWARYGVAVAVAGILVTIGLDIYNNQERPHVVTIDDVESLDVGLSLDEFRRRIGEPTWTSAAERLDGAQDWVEHGWVGDDYVVRAVTDRVGSVRAFFVSCLTDTFTPRLDIYTDHDLGERARLCETTFDQVDRDPMGTAHIDSGAPPNGRYWYHETYWLGAGFYRTVTLGDSYRPSATETLPLDIASPMFYGADFEQDPDELDAVRSLLTITTYGLADDGIDLDEFSTISRAFHEGHLRGL